MNCSNSTHRLLPQKKQASRELGGWFTNLFGWLLVLLCVPSPVNADWPAFRGPGRSGKIEGVQLPTRWSDDQNIRWQVDLPGSGWSSPIVVDQTIYLTSAVEAESSGNQRLILMKLDAESGQVMWQLDLFQPTKSPRIHRKNSHASPTPVWDGKHVFVHFGHQGTACVDPSGQVVWRNDQLAYPPVHGNGGSPTVVDDLLIFSRDGADTAVVTALDKRTGQLTWERPRDVPASKRFSFCTPLVHEIHGRRQLILPGSNVVQSLDPRTGEEIWRVRYDGYSVIPRPIYESGLVFVCTGYNVPSLLAIDPTGTGDVTETHVKWQTKTAVPHTPSLVGWDGKIAAVSDKGIASCYEAETGRQLWKQRVGGNFSASPLLVEDQLYLLSEEGVCTIYDVSDQPRRIARNDIGQRCLASLAVVEQDLLLRSANRLMRISAD